MNRLINHILIMVDGAVIVPIEWDWPWRELLVERCMVDLEVVNEKVADESIRA